MRELFGFLRALLQILRTDTILVIPGDALLDPTSMPLFIGAGHDEKLNFHLLEFANAKDKILRCDLVAVRLADLSNAKRQLPVGGIENVLEVYENTLRGFGPEIGDVLVIFDRSDCCFEHQIERTRFSQIVEAAFRTFFAGLDLVCAKALLTLAAI